MSKYSDSGVDIAAADELVGEIKNVVSSTTRCAGVVSDIGGFGAVFDLFASSQKYCSPLLVSSTDGVGTKLLVAQASGNHKYIGIDLVAMCVNDILALGARPLFFLDYFATGVLDNAVALEVVKSIVEGCKLANISLVGGETAEMPGMYSKGHYDVAGFVVGIVEKRDLLPKLDKISPGDIIIGVASSGLHSNGFSLVRKILQDQGINYNDPFPFSDENRTWADTLLEPTRIYTGSLLPAHHLLKAAAHITGGGLTNNIPRVLPKHLSARLLLKSWQQPSLFKWLENEAMVPTADMLETFNCGIGMVLITSPNDASTLLRVLGEHGETAYKIGEIIPRDSEPVVFVK